MIRRRNVLIGSGCALLAKAGYAQNYENSAQNIAQAVKQPSPKSKKADYSLELQTSSVEIAPRQSVQTVSYNGQVPGPLLTMEEGKQIVIDVFNNTDHAEMVHWHGLALPGVIDGAEQELTPFIQPKETKRFTFIPYDRGLRAYHTHVSAKKNLNLGLYSGLIGPLYVRPQQDKGAYDEEVFLTLKEFNPHFTAEGMDGPDFLLPSEKDPRLVQQLQAHQAANKAHHYPADLDLAYGSYTINGRCLGYGEPIRVRQGQRVLFHVLNGSATEKRSLSLPGHKMQVLALDGNPVPTQAQVDVIWLAALERASFIVEMTSPGIWVMGDVIESARTKGMGIVIEYAHYTGQPRWITPKDISWDYRRFAARNQATRPDYIIDMRFSESHNPKPGENINIWSINNKHFNPLTREGYYPLHYGKRYRVRFYNSSDEIHPLHLHRHSFEVTRIAGMPLSGLIKDVVMIGSCQTLEIDFVANQKGPSLFHCHMQHHMDYGFMAVFDCK